MKHKLSLISLLIFFASTRLFAYKQIEDVAKNAGGYAIPIKVCIPDNAAGKLPIMFFVHGGGWNGGDAQKVPDAEISADCNFLCDQMGIVFVGLAYRCKGNNGTFHLALQDLEASVKWFEDHAGEFHADLTRIGFSGASAGTTLSAVLAQRYRNCVVYHGREGMYNVLDLDSTLSHFPDSKSRAEYGLVTHEQKLEASPFYQVRKKPAMTLLCNGKDDWLCHYTQSIKYAEQLRKAGGKCKLILYNGINHTCLSPAYPEVFRNSLMELARLYAKGYNIKNVDFKAIKANLNNRTKLLFPYKKIAAAKILGSWVNNQFGTFIFKEDGKGEFINRTGKQTRNFTYKNNGPNLLVKVDGEEGARTFYLRKNDNTIYELITENNRFKSRRNDFRKL